MTVLTTTQSAVKGGSLSFDAEKIIKSTIDGLDVDLKYINKQVMGYRKQFLSLNRL